MTSSSVAGLSKAHFNLEPFFAGIFEVASPGGKSTGSLQRAPEDSESPRI
jgi:hypothetical protein